MNEKVEIIAELKDLISGKFKDINSQIDAMDNKLAKLNSGGIGGGKGIMGQVVGANLLTGAIQRATDMAIDFGKESFNAFGKQEQFQTSLKTLLYGNAEQATALNNQLKGFALETPFELTEIQDATKLMIAYGSSAGSVVDEMRMLGDVSSGVGSSIGEVAYLYGTLRTQGRAFSKDIYQFTGRGIPIVKELAKQFKVSEEAVMGLVEQGKVGFPQIERAFQSMTSAGGQFNGMMKEQSKNLLGQTSNLADAWDQLQSAIGQSQEGILKGTVQWATQMVNAIKRTIDKENYRDDVSKKVGDRYNDIPSSEKDKFQIVRDKKGNDRPFKTWQDAQSFIDKGNSMDRSMRPGYGEEKFEIFANSLFDKFQDVSKNDDAFNTKKLALIADSYKQKFDVEKGVGKGEISGILAANELQALDKVISDTKGLLGLDKSKKDAEKAKAVKEPAKLETLAKQNRAQQIIVNITNLVKELTNNVNSTQEAKQMSASEVSKILLGAVNDIYAVGQ